MQTRANEAAGGVRTMYGVVGSTGTIVNPGSADWSITKGGTGSYVVRFQRPFAAAPVFATTPSGTQFVSANASADQYSANVNTWGQSGAAADAQWAFQAVGR